MDINVLMCNMMALEFREKYLHEGITYLYAYTHTRTHARTHTLSYMHTHTHTQKMQKNATLINWSGLIPRYKIKSGNNYLTVLMIYPYRLLYFKCVACALNNCRSH